MFKEAFNWLIGNIVFSSIPFLFLWGATFFDFKEEYLVLIKGKLSGMVLDGFFVFVSIALSGSILLDSVNRKYNFNRFQKFTVQIFPIAMLIIASLIFLLQTMGTTNKDNFFTSPFWYIVVIISIFYCLNSKYIILEKDRKRDYSN